MEILINILIALGACVLLGLIFGAGAVFAAGLAPEKEEKEKKIEKTEKRDVCAFVRCGGGNDSSYKYTYVGAQDCAAAEMLAGGPRECRFACFGLGNCASVCPNEAISIKGGVAVIEESKCDGCGKCIGACPRGIIDLVPRDAAYKVRCRNVAQGSELRKICDMGCIGCMACANVCKYGAIEIIDNVAKIDYDKCEKCGECASVCPRGIISAPPVVEEPKAEEDAEFDVIRFIEDEKLESGIEEQEEQA